MQQSFGEQLLHEPAPARSDRQADRDLAPAHAGAREQQAGDVDARDEQHAARPPPSSTSADCRTVGSTRASRSGTAVALHTVPGARSVAGEPRADRRELRVRLRAALTPSFSRATTLMKFCGVVRYSA